MRLQKTKVMTGTMLTLLLSGVSVFPAIAQSPASTQSPGQTPMTPAGQQMNQTPMTPAGQQMNQTPMTPAGQQMDQMQTEQEGTTDSTRTNRIRRQEVIEQRRTIETRPVTRPTNNQTEPTITEPVDTTPEATQNTAPVRALW
ncbi:MULTISPECIES: hypothetical protein [Cyanophyceae]|uniref:hypothetical protein n=1 Tax=Cyanophyceae TaxID=3028117 RepID=UPI001687B5BE|nr:hypothetical protein [Trichocoleus sp. FACHB-69]MBD1932355.1 hypothetical protein [Trichocoleus sp. FACHB-69]